MITAHDRTSAVTLTGQAAIAAALADFERRYPAYAGTAVLDDMRARDYTRLDATGHIYLDYTGGGLYADSQLARHRDLLAGAVFGNPHSQNVSSAARARSGSSQRVSATFLLPRWAPELPRPGIRGREPARQGHAAESVVRPGRPASARRSPGCYCWAARTPPRRPGATPIW